ncbi:SMI1/KNR4 family protein [Shewanella corallii]|uniref:SMI1/KNR4 family protein n=1 Tax=Shewanella corallii TaxID=560080 RepID=A0ABT0N9V6_9GAMM|nr:SMI1/KNR4 family protein [Shewanella corallii]MCL2915246.1 SMI1/KNR4 family protein [Shewanella corallii]
MSPLSQIIPPPTKPTGLDKPGLWQHTELKLTTALPSDFRQLIQTYGSGTLGDFLWIWNPFTPEFIEEQQRFLQAETSLRQALPAQAAYSLFPHSPGFLPCASDDNGNYYGWLTEGQPDTWPTMTCEVRGSGFQLHRLSFSDYLVALFKGDIPALASDWPKAEHRVFESS